MNWPAILAAIALWEGRGVVRDDAYNAREHAVGRYQVRQCALDDVNAMLGTRVRLEECYNAQIGAWVLYHYTAVRWHARTPEHVARVWNGGPTRRGTDAYWAGVKGWMR